MKEDLIQRTRQALAGYRARRIEDDLMSPAAVLVLLYERDGQPHIVFTERSHDVRYHKGQISFPGGAVEADDADLLATALRETFEEIGVSPQEVEVIGQLDDLITVTDFRVTPYVGVLKREPNVPFVPHEREVAAVIEVPLRHLLDAMELELRERRGKPVLVPAYTYKNHRIWGATASILKGLLDLISEDERE